MSMNRIVLSSFVNTEMRRLRRMQKPDGDFTRKKAGLHFSEVRNMIQHKDDGYYKKFESYVPSLLTDSNVAGSNPFKKL